MKISKFCDWKEAFKVWLVEHEYMEGFYTDPWGEAYTFGELLKPIPLYVKLEIASMIFRAFPEINEDELVDYIFNYDRKRTDRRVQEA